MRRAWQIWTSQVMGVFTKAAPTEVPAVPRLRWCHGEYRTRYRPHLPCRWRDYLPSSVRESRLRVVCSLRQINLQSQTVAAGAAGSPWAPNSEAFSLCSMQQTGVPSPKSAHPVPVVVSLHFTDLAEFQGLHLNNKGWLSALPGHCSENMK